jgi:hypothetical protein
VNPSARRSLGLLVCAFGLISCGDGLSRQAKAVVFSVDGTATRKAENREPQAITVRSQLSTGDVIETETSARLRLSFLPGLLAEIGENSQAQIEMVRVAKDGNAMMDAMRAREVRLRITRGSLVAIVENNREGIGTFIVDTPFGVVTAMVGTLLKIDVFDQRARIICLRGNLQLQAAGGSRTILEPGFFEDWPSGIGVTRAADEDGKAQGDVVAAFDSQRELLALEKRERFAPAPWRRIPEKP